MVFLTTSFLSKLQRPFLTLNITQENPSETTKEVCAPTRPENSQGCFTVTSQFTLCLISTVVVVFLIFFNLM